MPLHCIAQHSIGQHSTTNLQGVHAGEVLGDVDLIWSNCRSFNEADSEICDLADQAQQALRMRWQQEGLPTVAPSAGKKQRKSGKKAVLQAGEPCVIVYARPELKMQVHGEGRELRSWLLRGTTC